MGGGLQLCLSCHKTGYSVLETLLITRKNIYETLEIEVSIDSNLNLTIYVFPWDLANDRDIILQSTEHHVVPKQWFTKQYIKNPKQDFTDMQHV